MWVVVILYFLMKSLLDILGCFYKLRLRPYGDVGLWPFVR